MWGALPLNPPPLVAAAPSPRRQLALCAGIQEAATEAEKQRRPPSGSDVLMKLNRVATTKKFNNRRATAPRRDDGDAAGKQAPSDVKPIYINPQWAHRLEELEARLQQLPHA